MIYIVWYKYAGITEAEKANFPVFNRAVRGSRNVTFHRFVLIGGENSQRVLERKHWQFVQNSGGIT